MTDSRSTNHGHQWGYCNGRFRLDIRVRRPIPHILSATSYARSCLPKLRLSQPRGTSFVPIRQAFRHFDARRKGKVSETDLSDGLRRLGLELTTRQERGLFRIMGKRKRVEHGSRPKRVPRSWCRVQRTTPDAPPSKWRSNSSAGVTEGHNDPM